MSTEDPRCPECGEKIGVQATYCMHCSADLSDEQDAADPDGDGDWDRDPRVADDQVDAEEDPIGSVVDAAAEELGADSAGPEPAADASESTGGGATDAPAGPSEPPGAGVSTGRSPAQQSSESSDDELLDSDGVVDNTLTVIVGIAAGIVVGLVATITVLVTVQSAWGFLLGLLAWVASTAHLVRRDTVQGAVSRGAYAVAAVLLLTSLIPLSPLVSVDGGVAGRIEGFVAALVVVAIPAGFAAVVGYVAGKFVPE